MNSMLYKILSGADEVHRDDDWVYFWSGDGSGKLYRVSTDGKQAMQVIEGNCCEIRFAGDWIFYCLCQHGETLHKIRKDGTCHTKLGDDCTREVNVVGDWIYYSNLSDDNNSLYRIRKDGIGKEKLNDDISRDIQVIGDWVYYRIGDNTHVYSSCDQLSLYKIRVDGTQRTKVADKTVLDEHDEYDSTDGEWIYYYKDAVYDEYRKIRFDGSEDTFVRENKPPYIQEAASSKTVDGWVYFCNKDGIFKTPEGSPEYCKISDDVPWFGFFEGCFEVFGGWIYYFTEDRAFRRVSTDGSSIAWD